MSIYGHSLSLLTDLYQLTMAYGYWKLGRADQQSVFHLTFRKHPFNGGYTVACGLHAAIDYVEGIGLDAIHAHETALVREARRALRGINSVRLFGPEESAGIVSFAMEGVHPHDVGTILDESRVAIRAGHHCAQPLMAHLGVDATARASFGVYNGRQDIEALVKGIDRVRRIFG